MARINNTHLKRSKTGKKLTRTVLIAAVVTTFLAATAAATVGIFSGINDLDELKVDEIEYTPNTTIYTADATPGTPDALSNIYFVSGGLVYNSDGSAAIEAPSIIIDMENHVVDTEKDVTLTHSENGLELHFTNNNGDEIVASGTIHFTEQGYNLLPTGEIVAVREGSEILDIEASIDSNGNAVLSNGKIIPADELYFTDENGNLTAPDGNIVSVEEMMAKDPKYFADKFVDGTYTVVGYFDADEVICKIDPNNIQVSVNDDMTFSITLHVSTSESIMALTSMTFSTSARDFVDQPTSNDLVFIGGSRTSNEFRAYCEWADFLDSYDTDNRIRDAAYADRSSEQFRPTYGAYDVYSQEMANKIDEICQKYGLETLTGYKEFDSSAELFDHMGIEPFIDGCSFDSGSGYTYDQGYINVEILHVELSDGFDASITLRRTPHGVFSTVLTSSPNSGWFEEWDYQTADGTVVHICTTATTSYILVDLDGAFVKIGVLHGSMPVPQYEQTAITRQQLELLAESIDWEKLS